MVFAPYETTPKTIEVAILDDCYAEEDEDFAVYLTGTTGGGASTGRSAALVTIFANDAVEPDIDILMPGGFPLEEEYECVPGGFVRFNGDDDDEDSVVDHEDDCVEGGDDDLLPIILRAIAGGGWFTLTFGNEAIRIWQNPDRTGQVVSDVSIFDAGVSHTLFVEAWARPDGPAAETISLNYGNSVFFLPCADEIVVHPLVLEFLTRNPATGEVYVPDDIAAGDPRPEVTIGNVDAQITSAGKLRITISGTFRDGLSELAHNVADRVQRLEFFVNWQLFRTIEDLPSLASGISSPWNPYPSAVSFTKTFELDNPAGVNVIRVQSSANAAGMEGWYLVGIRVEYHDVTSQYPGLDLDQLWEETLPAVDPTTGRQLQTRRFFQFGDFAAGSYIVRRAADVPPRIFAPTEIVVQDLGGSLGGNIEPLMLRVAGLDDTTAQYVSLNLEGRQQALAPFWSSPPKFYVVDDYPGSPRRIYVVTPRQMTPELEKARAGNIDIAINGGKVVAGLKTNWQDPYPREFDAEIDVLKHDLGDAPKTRWWESDHTTMEQMLTWFEILYGSTGLMLLDYYRQGGNQIELGDVLWDHDTDGWISGNGHLIIQIEEDLHPIKAAQYLWHELTWCLPYYKEAIIRHQDPQTLEWALHQAARNAGQIAASAAQLYLAGITILNEGADWVMTLYELSEGNWQAAIGFLPYIPAAALIGGKKVIVRDPLGREIHFTAAQIEALSIAARIAPTDLAGRYAIIEPLNLPIPARIALVEADFLKAPTKRGELRERMIRSSPLPGDGHSIPRWPTTGCRGAKQNGLPPTGLT